MADDRVPPGVYFCKGPVPHSWVDPEDAAKCCAGYERVSCVSRDADGNAILSFEFRPKIADAADEGDAETESDEESTIVPPPGAGDDDEPGPFLQTGQTDGLHQAFWQRAADLTENDPAWLTIAAGLLTLRLVDRWMKRNASGHAPTFKEFVIVRRAIKKVADDRLAEILLQLTDTLRDFSHGESGSVPKLLYAYGLMLEEAGEWSLAADVYETVIAHARTLAEPDGVVLAYGRLGYCLRQSTRVADAARVYERGLALARMIGDRPGELRLKICQANLALHVGDVAGAVRMLDAVIEEARTAGEPDQLAAALHDRGQAAMKRDDAVGAAEYFYAALDTYEAPSGKERAVTDLGEALLELGIREAARDAFRITEATAQQLEPHVHALSGLMRLATVDGDYGAFVTYAERVRTARGISVRLQAACCQYEAEGYLVFGYAARSEMCYHALRYLAVEHGLAEYARTAEDGLRGLGCSVRLRERPVPAALVPIVDNVRALRIALEANTA